MRVFSIELDGKPFINPVNPSRQLRVVFSTAMNYSENLGSLDLAIYNLAQTTQILSGQRIVFKAGYDDTSESFQTIFNGTVTTVFKERDGANIVTRVLCRSGDIMDRPDTELSFGRDTTVTQILDATARSTGLKIDYQPEQFEKQTVFTSGYVLRDDVRKELDNLAQQGGFSWAHDGTRIVIDKGKSKRTGIVHEVSLKTGLIGMPEETSNNTGIFVNVTTKLNPALRIGGLFELKSQYATFNTGNMYLLPPEHGGNLDGQYKIMTVSHEGDSWGEVWRTKFEGMRNA